jgi:hypothetical protein
LLSPKFTRKSGGSLVLDLQKEFEGQVKGGISEIRTGPVHIPKNTSIFSKFSGCCRKEIKAPETVKIRVLFMSTCRFRTSPLT